MSKLTLGEMAVVIDDITPDSGQFDIESMMRVYFSAKAQADEYTRFADLAKDRIESVMLANGSAKETTSIGVASITAGSVSVSYDAKALDILCNDDSYLADRIAVYRKESIRKGSLRIVATKG